MNRALILAAAGVLLIRAGVAQVAPQQVEKFTIHRKHALQVALPEGWRIVGPQEFDEGVLTVTLGPLAGKSFKFLISAFLVGKGADAPVRSPQEMKLMLNLFGLKALERAVEPQLIINEAQGRQGVGYYYRLTDKRDPLPLGEFRYLWQALFAIGEIRSTATLLSDSTDEPLLATALKLLQTAEDVQP